MDSNWLAVFGAVLIAIAGGLAFVAYRHPAAFRENLGIPLAVFTTVAFIFLSFWNLGALHAQSEALLNAVKGSGSSTSATVSSLAERIRDTYLLEVYGLLLAPPRSLHIFYSFLGSQNSAWSERTRSAAPISLLLARRLAQVDMLLTSLVDLSCTAYGPFGQELHLLRNRIGPVDPLGALILIKGHTVAKPPCGKVGSVQARLRQKVSPRTSARPPPRPRRDRFACGLVLT